MHLAAALLTVALAAPVHPGAPALAVGEPAVSGPHAAASQALDEGERRPSRARRPMTPPIRRLLRKRDLLAPVLPTGGSEDRDRSLAFLARALDHSAASLLGRLRARPEPWRVRGRLQRAGVLTHALHRPPPTLPG